MVGNSIKFDTVLELCQDQHRRIVLAVLANEQRSLTMNDLAKTVIKHNHHTAITEVSEEVRTRVQLSLHHAHVPKLEAEGVVEVDPERKLVEPTAQFDRLQPALSAIIDADPALEPPVEL